MVKLEEGKYYRTRDGRKVGPMQFYGAGYQLLFCCVNGLERFWRECGKHHFGCDEIDLVAEWVEETTMDIYSLEKPLGMYPQEIRDALYAYDKSGGKVQAWGGWGWAFCEKPAFSLANTYRAVKKPEVVEAVIFGHVVSGKYFTGSSIEHSFDTHKITFNLVDGVPDCNSIKMVALSDQSKPSF
jgi:hypothetical protein